MLVHCVGWQVERCYVRVEQDKTYLLHVDETGEDEASKAVSVGSELSEIAAKIVGEYRVWCGVCFVVCVCGCGWSRVCEKERLCVYVSICPSVCLSVRQYVSEGVYECVCICVSPVNRVCITSHTCLQYPPCCHCASHSFCVTSQWFVLLMYDQKIVCVKYQSSVCVLRVVYVFHDCNTSSVVVASVNGVFATISFRSTIALALTLHNSSRRRNVCGNSLYSLKLHSA